MAAVLTPPKPPNVISLSFIVVFAAIAVFTTMNDSGVASRQSSGRKTGGKTSGVLGKSSAKFRVGGHQRHLQVTVALCA